MHYQRICRINQSSVLILPFKLSTKLANTWIQCRLLPAICKAYLFRVLVLVSDNHSKPIWNWFRWNDNENEPEWGTQTKMVACTISCDKRSAPFFSNAFHGNPIFALLRFLSSLSIYAFAENFPLLKNIFSKYSHSTKINWYSTSLRFPLFSCLIYF